MIPMPLMRPSRCAPRNFKYISHKKAKEHWGKHSAHFAIVVLVDDLPELCECLVAQPRDVFALPGETLIELLQRNEALADKISQDLIFALMMEHLVYEFCRLLVQPPVVVGVLRGLVLGRRRRESVTHKKLGI